MSATMLQPTGGGLASWFLHFPDTTLHGVGCISVAELCVFLILSAVFFELSRYVGLPGYVSHGATVCCSVVLHGRRAD